MTRTDWWHGPLIAACIVAFILWGLWLRREERKLTRYTTQPDEHWPPRFYSTQPDEPFPDSAAREGENEGDRANRKEDDYDTFANVAEIEAKRRAGRVR